ncbi:MAG: acetate/propionate family kinase [Pseudomonadota bacterium]
MSQAIVVFNAGSSSLKFSLFPAQPSPGMQNEAWLHGQIDGLGVHPHLQAHTPDGTVVLQRDWPDSLGHDEALGFLLDAIQPFLQGHTLCAVGHRIVHGGTHFHAPVLLDDAVLAELDTLVPLAPLHQPHNLAPVRALQRVAHGLPQVGCFDTAFHTTCPPVAQRFALPRALHDAGVRRYGFHGLSYEYIASQLTHVDAHAAQGRTVVMHLGNGASMCALQGGRSVASSMGFTALDGLMMGTRCGSLDAGVLLWLMDERGMDARAIERLLYKDSGLLGVSGGLSSDMRTLLASDRVEAQEAVALYVHRITRELGALAAVLGGLDAIVFTAGIGEHAAPIRAQVCAQAAWLGVRLDEAANAAASDLNDGQSLRISKPDSAVAVWVMPTDEERMIAQHTRRLALGR